MNPTVIAVPARRARRWPYLLAALVLLFLVCLVAAASMAEWVFQLPNVSVVIDGERVLEDLRPAQLPPAHRVVLVGVAAVALLAALVVLPLALFAGAVALVLLVAGGVGLPLLAMAVLAAVVLSPLWLAAWLLWRWLAAKSPASAPSPTMPA